jgi:hypothetical protein
MLFSIEHVDQRPAAVLDRSKGTLLIDWQRRKSLIKRQREALGDESACYRRGVWRIAHLTPLLPAHLTHIRRARESEDVAARDLKPVLPGGSLDSG